MQNLIVTIIQPDLAWEDKGANLAKFESFFHTITGKQDLVVLPEMFNTGFVMNPKAIAEPMEGPTMQWMANYAGITGSVITGSLVINDKDHFYNRLIWMTPDGNYSYYDKRHLFRFGNEHLEFSNGQKRLVTEINGWKICPLVCYDLRFPVWSKNTFQHGKYEYDLLIYVANWPARRSYAYRQLLIARAIENQSYVIGVNRVGVDGKGTMHQGDSVIIDFKGNPLIDISTDVEDMKTLMLDYDQIEEFRDGFTVGMDWDDFEIR